jgi:hypothetical protein
MRPVAWCIATVGLAMTKVMKRRAKGRYLAGNVMMYMETFALGFSCAKV